MDQSSPKPAAPSLGPLQNIIGYYFRRAWNALRKDFEASLHDLGLRQVHIGILSVIHANPGIKQGVVGNMLDIQRANMVSLIAELGDAGWVVRGEDRDDRRAIALSLSPSGEKLLAEALERIERHERYLFSGLDANDCARLVEMLKIVGDRPPATQEPR